MTDTPTPLASQLRALAEEYAARHFPSDGTVIAIRLKPLATLAAEQERELAELRRLLAVIERTCEQFAFAPTTSTTEEMSQSFLSLARATRAALDAAHTGTEDRDG